MPHEAVGWQRGVQLALKKLCLAIWMLLSSVEVLMMSTRTAASFATSYVTIQCK